MKPFVLALFLALLLSASGCMSYPRGEIGFWDQQVGVTAWGFTMATPYGPFNIGYLQWQRNLEENLKPAKPSDAGKLLGGGLRP